MKEASVITISGSTNLIEGSGRANVLLPRGIRLKIDNALYSTKSQRNLLSFKDIRNNGYHIETAEKENVEYLRITKMISNEKRIVEKLPSFSSGLYYTYLSTIEVNVIVNQKFTNDSTFVVWHDRLGHPGAVMMRKIIENSRGHLMKNQKILQSKELLCDACSKGKLIIRPSPVKL